MALNALIDNDGALSIDTALDFARQTDAATLQADALIELKLDGYAALDRLCGTTGDAAFLLAWCSQGTTRHCSSYRRSSRGWSCHDHIDAASSVSR